MDTLPLATPGDYPLQSSAFRKTVSAVGFIALLGAPVVLLIVLQRSAKTQMLRPGTIMPIDALAATDPGRTLVACTGGKNALIFFFSVDCPHCQRQIPILKETWKVFGSQVEFIAVALSDWQRSAAFLRTNEIGARALIDENGVVGRLFGVSELPTIFFVDRDQKIVWAADGEQSKGEILRRLKALAGTNASTATQDNGNNQK